MLVVHVVVGALESILKNCTKDERSENSDKKRSHSDNDDIVKSFLVIRRLAVT